MKKISQILRETDVQQIYGHLISYGDDGEFEGKCVLGVLSCESGVPSFKLDKDHNGVALTYAILEQYDSIPKEYLEEAILPSIYIIQECHSETISIDMTISLNWNTPCTLTHMIMNLNDIAKLTFSQIADFLEVTFDL